MPVHFKNYVVRSNNFRTAREMTLRLLHELLPLGADTVVRLHGMRLWPLLLLSNVLSGARASCSIRDFDVPRKCHTCQNGAPA
jgi:hypothetical protein